MALVVGQRDFVAVKAARTNKIFMLKLIFWRFKLNKCPFVWQNNAYVTSD
ncbi:MAG: hypothetical protein JO126_05695 [Alphaproteobacteria bacterium]|nr:hypothetical protein [Alphaproteobacteria bacterium]MBV8548931.1 hypothetical protein [Alphaproteobacteria bacterium]